MLTWHRNFTKFHEISKKSLWFQLTCHIHIRICLFICLSDARSSSLHACSTAHFYFAPIKSSNNATKSVSGEAVVTVPLYMLRHQLCFPEKIQSHKTDILLLVPSPKCMVRTRLRASRETSAFSRRAMRMHILSQLGSKKASSLSEHTSGQDQARSPLTEYQGSDLFAKNL